VRHAVACIEGSEGGFGTPPAAALSHLKFREKVMPIFALSIILQVAFIIHIVKTGRNTYWIWIVLMLPLAGSLAYFVVELLPELMGSSRGRKTIKTIDGVINPHREIKQAQQNFSIADTVENTRRLAEECLTKQRYDEASSLFDKCLKGMYENDPYMLHGKARAEFGLGHYAEVITALDRLKQHNPDFKNGDAHLLYAMALDAQDKRDEAAHEYETLARYYPGPEPKCRYALMLQKMGKPAEAEKLFAEVIATAKHSGKHYESLHSEWIKLAKKNGL